MNIYVIVESVIFDSFSRHVFHLHVEFYILVSRLPRLKTGHSWHTLCSQSSRPVVYVLSGVGKKVFQRSCHTCGLLGEGGKKNWRELVMLMKLVSL